MPSPHPGSTRAWLLRTLRAAGWAPLLVLLAYGMASWQFNAYRHYPWLDMPTHFAGGWAITYFFLTGLADIELELGATPRAMQYTAGLGLTAITAIVWEFFEYLADLFLGSTLNLGMSDTVSDLLCSLLGGMLAITLAHQRARG